MLVSILSAAILSRYFNKTEYGTYKQIIFIYTTLLTVFQAGLPSVFSYFLPKYSHAAGKFIVNKINRILFILGVLLSVTIFASSNLVASLLNNVELARGLRLFSIFPVFTLPTLGLEGIYIVNKNTRFVAIYNTITRLLMLACIVLPVVFIRNSYETAIIGWGAASFLAFIIALCYKTKPYNDVETAETISGFMKEVLAYSLPIMGSSSVLMFYNSINQILISRYFGTAAFAEFSNGFMPLPFIAIFINPIRQLLVPMISKANSEETLEQTKSFFSTSVYELALLIIPMIAFCVAFSKSIMVFLYGEQYAASYVFFIIALAFNYFEIFPMQVVLSGLGKTRKLFAYDIIYTIVLYGVNLLLIRCHLSSPVIIAVVFTVVQIMLRYVTPYIYLRGRMNFSPVSLELLKKILLITLHVSCAAFASYFISKAFSDMPIIADIALSGICFYIILIGTGFLFKINYLWSFDRLLHRK